jgi:hypothetical protein
VENRPAGKSSQRQYVLLFPTQIRTAASPTSAFSSPSSTSQFITNYHQLSPSPIITYHHPSSPIITHHHPSSPIITHHHPSSPIITHHHPSSPITTYIHLFISPTRPGICSGSGSGSGSGRLHLLANLPYLKPLDIHRCAAGLFGCMLSLEASFALCNSFAGPSERVGKEIKINKLGGWFIESHLAAVEEFESLEISITKEERKEKKEKKIFTASSGPPRGPRCLENYKYSSNGIVGILLHVPRAC